MSEPEKRHESTPDRRETSLADRILAWARTSGKPFGPEDVAKHFGVTPEEATSVLGTLARRERGFHSPSTGVYQFLSIGSP